MRNGKGEKNQENIMEARRKPEGRRGAGFSGTLLKPGRKGLRSVPCIQPWKTHPALQTLLERQSRNLLGGVEF